MSSSAKNSPSFEFMVPVSVGMGMVFGFALEKGRVFEPSVIIGQFTLGDFQMLKMFLSAVAAASASMSVLSVLPMTKDAFARTRKHWCESPKGIGATALGSSMLGVGMALAGACPGTVVAQLGAGVLPSAAYVLVGGLAAAGLHTLLYDSLFSKFQSSGPFPRSQRTLDDAAGLPYAALGLPLAVGMGACVAALEMLFPFRTMHGVGTHGPWLQRLAWAPWYSGALIGALQIPAILLLGVTIGSATSYVTACIQGIRLASPRTVRKSNYMSRLSKGLAYWQPLYLLGAFAGAMLSAGLSGSYASVREAPSPLVSMMGGAFLLMGARIAGGCTSGHGISGFAQLSSASFVAVPAMFGAAIAAAQVFSPAGLYQGMNV